MSYLFIFSIISCSSLALFFQPVFALRALHSLFMANGITKWTVFPFSGLFEKMPVFTVSLTVCPNAIYLLRNKLQVIWITASLVFTEMIYLKILTCFYSSWYGVYKISIKKSMGSFCLTSIMGHAIPKPINTTFPKPAGFGFPNFSKNPATLFFRKINFKIYHINIIPQTI